MAPPETHIEQFKRQESLRAHRRGLPSVMTTTLVTLFRVFLNVLLMPYFALLSTLYVNLEKVIVYFFAPPMTPKRLEHPHGRIAVIGAGLTGVASAAHCVAHGFEVVLYESTDRVGGIWAHENEKSSLQLNSMMYRFHPAVVWKSAFPQRDEILHQVNKIWKLYRLDERTRFNTPVTKVDRKKRPEEGEAHHISPSEWYINGGEDGPFDALIVAVGTCGKPKWITLGGLPEGVLDRNPRTEPPKEISSYDHDDSGSGSQSQENQDEEKHHVGTEYPHGKGVTDSMLKNERKKRRKHRKRAREAREAGEEPAPEDAEFELESATSNGGADTDASHVKHEGSPKRRLAEVDHHQPLQTNKDLGVFRGKVLHSCELDNATEKDFEGKKVLVFGSDASGVQAVEMALSRGAKKCVLIVKEDKWIIPRNVVLDTILAAQPFGRNMPFSSLWEWFLSAWHYHGVGGLVPDKDLFADSPIVHDTFPALVRSEKCEYVRGDALRFTSEGALVHVLERRKATRSTVKVVPRDEVIKGDIVVMATGYDRPSTDFLPKELFPEGYRSPDLWLQNFSTEDWSVLTINSAHENVTESPGNKLIGMHTRILLTMMLDPSTRPDIKHMKAWVDNVRSMKDVAKRGAFDAYGLFAVVELFVWMITFIALRPRRLPLLFFILQGKGVHPAHEVETPHETGPSEVETGQSDQSAGDVKDT